MDQIRANTPAPIKANLMTEQLSVQISWGNGGCTRADSPGDKQTRDFGPWHARHSRAMMRANAWGHDELRRFQTLGYHNMEILSWDAAVKLGCHTYHQHIHGRRIHVTISPWTQGPTKKGAPKVHALGSHKMEIRPWDTAVLVCCHSIEVNPFCVFQLACPCN